MALRDMRISLKLDGENEFNKALKAMDRETKILTSELSKLESQFDLTGDSQGFLTSKSDILAKKIDQQEFKVKALRQAMIDANDKYKDGGKVVDDYQISLNYAERALTNMRKELAINEKAIQENENAMREFDKSIDEAADGAGEAGSDMEKTFSDFASAVSGDLGGVVDTIIGMTDKMGEAGNITGTSASGMSLALGAVTSAAAAIITTIAKIGEEMREQTRIVKIEATEMEIALGISKQDSNAMAESGKRVYAGGYAESLDQAMQYMKISKAYLRDLDNETLEKIAKHAGTLVRVTGADFGEIIKAAATMKEEFGIAIEETMDILQAVAQVNPIEASQIMESFTEYSVQFKQLGFTAVETASIMAIALENNVWSIDKVADAYKELNIRAKDGSESTREALSSLGLDADKTMWRIAHGGDGARQEIEKIIERLDRMPNKFKQNEIGVALMGSQWEDVGAKAILNMDGMAGKMSEINGLAAKNTEKLSQEAITGSEKAYRVIEANHGKTAAGIMKWATTVFSQMYPFFNKVEMQALDGGTNAGGAMVEGIITGMEDRQNDLYAEAENIFEEMWKNAAEMDFKIEMAVSPIARGAQSRGAPSTPTYNDYSQNTFKVDDIETYTAIKRRMENERQSKRMGYVGR